MRIMKSVTPQTYQQSYQQVINKFLKVLSRHIQYNTFNKNMAQLLDGHNSYIPEPYLGLLQLGLTLPITPLREPIYKQQGRGEKGGKGSPSSLNEENTINATFATLTLNKP